MYTVLIACNYYWCKTNMQIVRVTVPAEHQITPINKLELTFSWKWNSKQKIMSLESHNNKLTQNLTFQDFFDSQKS